MKSRILAIAILLSFLAVGTVSCVSVPPEAPELSAELGRRIAKIKQSHLNLVDLFFEEKRDNISEFIETEWLPTYIDNLFEQEFIANEWEKACTDENTQQRHRFMVQYARVIRENVAKKRKEMFSPLNELETALSNRLNEEYRHAISMNTVLTGYLTSAAELDENRQRAYEIMGIQEEQVSSALHKVDSIVGSITSKAEDFENNIPKYKEKIQDLINKIN